MTAPESAESEGSSGSWIVTGLMLPVIVDVHGVAIYLAWSLIGLAPITVTAATLVYRRRLRGGPRS